MSSNNNIKGEKKEGLKALLAQGKRNLRQVKGGGLVETVIYSIKRRLGLDAETWVLQRVPVRTSREALIRQIEKNYKD